MAFGFSPKHEQTIELENLTKEEFLVVSIEVIKQLEWNLSHVSEKGFIAYTNFSMSSYSEELKIIIDKNTVTVKSVCTGSQLFDWGKNKKNVESFISTFNSIKDNYTHDILLEKYTELNQTFVPSDQDILNQAPLNTKQKITNFFSIFKPTEGYTITPIILNLNLFVFIIMVASGVNIFMPESQELLDWGANYRSVTLNGQCWRLLTCCFLHIGVFHLLMNMYALISISVLLEPLLGKTRFLAAYLLSGIIASLTSLAWNDLTISAGASGAIFGMYGVFLALLTTNHIEKSAREAMRTSVLIFVGYNLLNGMKAGIDNAAHIGGLVSGMTIGYAFLPSLKQSDSSKLKHITIGIMLAATICIGLFIFKNTSNDIGKYEESMKEFTSLEDQALEVYRLPETANNDIILNTLHSKGIKNWEKCLELISNLEKLDLPNNIQERNKALKLYCEMRIECYQLIDKAITENTDQYRSMIDSSNIKIERLINSLSK